MTTPTPTEEAALLIQAEYKAALQAAHHEGVIGWWAWQGLKSLPLWLVKLALEVLLMKYGATLADVFFAILPVLLRLLNPVFHPTVDLCARCLRQPPNSFDPCVVKTQTPRLSAVVIDAQLARDLAGWRNG